MAYTSAIRSLPETGLQTRPGRSLRDLLLEGVRPDRTTLIGWGCELLQILAEAHARGFAYRQIGEDEVTVSPEGRLAVLRSPQPAVGEIYMVQHDLHAVGCLLRRLAFAGAVRSGRKPGDRDPLVKALARATCTGGARYANAAEMAEALREAGRTAVSRRLGGSSTSGKVAEFLPAAARRGSPPAPSGAADEEGEDVLWRALLLLVASLLLMTVLLVAGGFFLDHQAAREARRDTGPAAALAGSR